MRSEEFMKGFHPLPIIIQAAKRLPKLLTPNSTLLTFVESTSTNYYLFSSFLSFLKNHIRNGTLIKNVRASEIA